VQYNVKRIVILHKMQYEMMKISPMFYRRITSTSFEPKRVLAIWYSMDRHFDTCFYEKLRVRAHACARVLWCEAPSIYDFG